MHNIKKTLIIAALSAMPVASFAGCSTVESSIKPEIGEEFEYLKNLEEGAYYVLHSDKTYEKLITGDTSFKDEVANMPSDKRTIWFKEDWENVPTLYKDDSLIYYSKAEIDEQFAFERFEDFGYTVGVRALTPTESRRYSIATDQDKKQTYPGGDTDDILLLSNENVLIDKFAGVELRAPREAEPGEEGYVPEEAPVTRCGTIKGLNKNGTYDAEVWDGTQKYTFKWKADVRALGSMETAVTHDFTFSSDTVIKIDIPEDFKTGYYMINAKGFFRYVPDSTTYNENTDFNVPSAYSMDKGDENENEGSAENLDPRIKEAETLANIYNDEQKGTFPIDEAGQIYVKVYVNSSDEEMKGVDALVETPSGANIKMIKNGTEFSLVFIAEETGIYTVRVYGLNGKEMTIDAGYVEEQ